MTRRHCAALMAASLLDAQTGPPKKARNLSSVMLWTLPGSFEEKLAIAGEVGLQSVELVDEHIRWTDAEIASARKRARSLRLGMDTILAQPDWARRPVSMVNPAHREAFLSDLRQAITFAQKLEIPQIILMSGNSLPGVPREQQYASMREGASRASELAAAADLTLIIEPLNDKVDHAGFFLTTCAEGLRLVREVGSPHLRLLFDIYHEQVQTGSVIPMIDAAAALTAVFHIADAPGRHDPGTGSMPYREIYEAVQKSGFAGYLCMEYLPASPPVASLRKAVDDMRARLGASGA